MKQTFKTDHPIIKEITIGDILERNDGVRVMFEGYDKNIYHGKIHTPFHIGVFHYNINLLFGGREYNKDYTLHIKGSNALIKLKDKIKMI